MEFDEDDDFNELIDAELIQELQQFATDDIEKSKKYNEYLNGKVQDELFEILVPHCFQTGKGLLKTVNYFEKEEKIKYIDENKENIIRQNLMFLPITDFEKLEEIMKSDGYVEELLDYVYELDELYFLKNLGLIFVGVKGKKLQIHIPNEIKQIIDKLFKEEHIKQTNINVNDKINFIKGSLQIYGAISTHKLYEVYKEFFEETEEEYFKKIQTMTMLYREVAFTIIQEEHRVILHDPQITKQEAIELGNKNDKRQIKHYEKQEYMKFAKTDFIEKTEAYDTFLKHFVEVFYFDEDDEDTSLDILLTAKQLAKTYIALRKHGQPDIENQVRRQLKLELSDNFEDDIDDEEIDETIDGIMEDLNKIAREYPYLKDI